MTIDEYIKDLSDNLTDFTFIKDSNNHYKSGNDVDIRWFWITDVNNNYNSLAKHFELRINTKDKVNNITVEIHFEEASTAKNLYKELLNKTIGQLEKTRNRNSLCWLKRKDAKLISIENESSIADTIEELHKLYEIINPILAYRNTSNNQNKNEDMKLLQPLNTILYGPPGTGKTYHTITKAIAIANPTFDLLQSRDILKGEYDRLIKEGQIVFTTFHQSMTYEDFIEGIKPLKPLPQDSFVKYEVQDGIFKNICKIADTNIELNKNFNKHKRPFTEVFEQLKLDWEDNTDMAFPLRTEGYDFTIIGFTSTSIQFKKASGGTSHTLSIKTLEELYYGKEYNFKAGVGIYYPSILKRLDSYNVNVPIAPKEEKNYIIIIDEINRGNVSAIFGELITLIEETKRAGKDEALEVTLPYSKETFSVPSNVFIIGTMNTADRSVEALDTALRRRFSFEEMMPDYGLPELETEIFGNKAKDILQTINQRICVLLDREHQIGHSYFIGKDENSILDSFYKNIIPLLQEYFFGDYGKIGLVLGNGFVEKIENKKHNKLFAEFVSHSEAGQYDEVEKFEIVKKEAIFDNMNGKDKRREVFNSLMNKTNGQTAK